MNEFAKDRRRKWGQRIRAFAAENGERVIEIRYDKKGLPKRVVTKKVEPPSAT